MWFGEEIAPRIEALYLAMDAAYGRAAALAGFSCAGCDGEACCTVDLPLRTHTEKLYLKMGLGSLERSQQRAIIRRSVATAGLKADAPHGDAYRGAVCVLNTDGKCSLYAYRPMICRLAGLPHTITRPDGKQVRGDGCARFMNAYASSHPDIELDRTGFYQELASIEVEMVRRHHSRSGLETIAEVLAGA